MIHKTTTNATPLPSVNITINKSRLKIYNKEKIPTVYLKNNQEFELELFNPKQNTICARISINNNLISEFGLVIKPGERIFLYRYIDTPNKFKFKTYEVGTSKEVKKAIENNGNIKIEFYNEKFYDTKQYYPTGDDNLFIGYNHSITYTSDINTNFTGSGDNIIKSSNTTLDSLNTTTGTYKMETGRVENGSHSDQKFIGISKEFCDFPFLTLEYKILPESQRNITQSDIRIYCHNCGSKAKQNYKFCPKCGTKID